MGGYVIVSADDFGSDRPTNEAILAGHRFGVIGAAGLMVNEHAASDAIAMARDAPGLDVGLHLVLSGGLAALTHWEAPSLVDRSGRLRPGVVHAGVAYWFRRDLRRAVRTEVRAQFARFARSGLACTHVDGHLHLHMHPVVWDELCLACAGAGVPWIRLPCEEWRPSRNVPIGRRLEWTALRWLAPRCRRVAGRHGLRVADRVYGHVNSGFMDERCMISTLGRMTGKINEVYLHPGASDVERRTVVSESVREALAGSTASVATFGELAGR